jgi:DNA-binding response OmpR family regulator
MLTTEAADVMVDKALVMGADAYITKPVTIDELKNAIKRAYQAHGRI